MSNQTDTSPEQPRRRPNRRRRLIVDKPFQYRLIGLLLAIWTANSIFFSIILYYFYQGHIQQFYTLVPRPGMLPRLSTPVLFSIAIAFILVFGLIMVAIIGTYLSNQIAGPLYRVKLSLNRVSQGDVNFEVQFRDRDFLMDFPGYFNNMLRGLKEQGASDIEALKTIENNMDDTAKARELLRGLRARKEKQFGGALDASDAEPQPNQLSQAVH